MENIYHYDGKSFTYKELKEYFESIREKNKDRKKSIRWPETLKLIEGKRVLDFGCWKGSQTYTCEAYGLSWTLHILATWPCAH